MMKTLIKNINIFSVLITILLFNSCEDEIRLNGTPYEEGFATLNVSVSYLQETGVNVVSRAVPNPSGGEVGTLISDIKSLSMLVYDENGVFIEKYDIVGGAVHPDVSNVNNSSDDNRLPDEKDENSQIKDSSTGKVTFDLKLYSGKYFIYAVANMNNLSDYSFEEYSSPDKLKSIEAVWSDNVSENGQMFGVFSLESNRDADDKTPITISAKDVQLHCWVRRLASKVTVAFDGEDLYDDVQVYIETVTLKDIPRKCKLGFDNAPGVNSDGTSMEYSKEKHDELLTDGQTIVYQTIQKENVIVLPDNYYHVCNNLHKYFGKGAENKENPLENANNPEVVDKIHTNDYAHSLFFYENMQGKGKSKHQDAINNDTKDETPDNIIDFPNPDENISGTGWKDEKPYGTYVEVCGYYRCASRDGNMTSGPIKYRFMLGQDADKDYDAKRNTHYRLTLKFKGYGNDADWHIEYKYETGISVNSPQYISYLYNKKMMATVRIIGQIDPNHPYLFASIVGTKDLKNSEVPFPTDGVDESAETPFKTGSWHPWGEKNYIDPETGELVESKFPEPPAGYYFDTAPITNDGPWNSFLSLRQTNVLRVVDPNYPGSASRVTSDATTYNQTFWENRKSGWRYFNAAPGTYPDATDGQYIVYALNHENGKVTESIFSIPLYTRPKELITKTGFVGNNPYSGYARKMRIRLSAYILNSEGISELKHTYLDIIQVRRIENPKGVWRKKGSVEDFNATLTIRPQGMEGNFVEVISDGKWSAEVFSGDNIVSLSSTTKGSGNIIPQKNVMRIEGAAACPVDFMINFNGTPGCAIIRVRYNNYTCEHDIFCRNGHEADVDVVGNGTKWSSRNVYRFDGTKPVLTNSPLEAGSLFRRGCYTAILSSNDDKYALGVLPGDLDVIDNANKSSTMPWSNIKAASTADIREWKVEGDKHIATIDEFYEFCAPDDENRDFYIKKAYGVLYGDGASKTQTDASIALGYTRIESDEYSPKSEYGMRGVFVYNARNSQQVFLPIGATGYGRRKRDGGWNNEGKAGVLRYATRSAVHDGTETLKKTPMFYDLYIRPGAIYWCKDKLAELPKLSFTTDDGKVNKYNDVRKSCDFDINYFSMGFEGFENGAAADESNTDACYIRTVSNK